MSYTRISDALCVLFTAALAMLGMATIADCEALSPAVKFAVEVTWPVQLATAAFMWMFCFGDRIFNLRLQQLRSR
ncbi:MAG: hypothetical protein EKK47_20050 [Burkholderiales bacterium]|nr:MAG: hypothetical protein EKK47_20050 [Burkholderiales bacterium]